MLKQKISQIIGKEVHFAFLLDFSGFRTFIDRIGGVPIEVKTQVYDDQYPDGRW